MIRAVSVRHICQAPAVRRPGDLAFLGGCLRHANRIAAVPGRNREHLAVDRERGLPAVGRERQLLQLIAERAVLDARRRRRAPQCDGHLMRLAARGVDRPDAEIALEGDRAAVPRDRRPQHAAVRERRHRLRAGLGVALHAKAGDRPDVLRAAAVGHQVQTLAAGGPHRPRVLRAAARELFVTRAGPRGRGAHDPDLALVEMAVPLAPPLRRGVGAGGDGHRLAAGRRRREILRRVPVRRDRHRRPAFDADAVDVQHPGNLVAVRLKQHRLAVGGPAAHQLVRVVVREPRHVAAREREHVHVAVPRASGGEGEPLAVRREQRARLGGGMRHEQPRVAAAGRHFPDVAAAHERDRGTVGRNARLGKGWKSGHAGARCLCDNGGPGAVHDEGRGPGGEKQQLLHGHASTPCPELFL